MSKGLSRSLLHGDIAPRNKRSSVHLPSDVSAATLRLNQFDFLIPGEEVKSSFPDATLLLKEAPDPAHLGTMYITNYRFIFTSETDEQSERPLFAIPLRTIGRVKEKKKKEQLLIVCKHGRRFVLTLPDKTVKTEALHVLQRYAFPSAHQLFAFIHSAFDDGTEPVHFDLEDDYRRIGLDSCPTVRWIDNSDYKYCSTYPSVLVVPATFTDDQLLEVSRFRSRGRIPAIVWRHPDNGALIVRSAQPSVGFKKNHSAMDERLLRELRNTQQTILYIMDSRPKANAVANMLRGGGYELAKFYKDTQIEFNNIDNIHAMRNSLQAVYDYCATLPDDGSPITEKNLPTELEESHWFSHLRLVLEAVQRTVELVHHQAASVLVHCSDGWDRTAQVGATAELLLDPYYRTLEGFLRLLDKEWVQFGHQFALRYGHSDGTMENYKESQRSPIFPQWLDLLFQLLLIFPTAFEFNEALLLVLMEELFSCRYGNFLYDCEQERKELSVATRTKSLWSYILHHSDFFRNPRYAPDPSILLLDMAHVNVTLWTAYYIHFRRYGPPIVIPSNTNSSENQNKRKRKKRSRRQRRSDRPERTPKATRRKQQQDDEVKPTTDDVELRNNREESAPPVPPRADKEAEVVWPTPPAEPAPHPDDETTDGEPVSQPIDALAPREPSTLNHSSSNDHIVDLPVLENENEEE